MAGDLFEDNQVDDTLVSRVVALFGADPELPVYLLPGNHDPFTGPDCVWQRTAFLNAPANVHVLREAGVTELGAPASTSWRLLFTKSSLRRTLA